MTTFSSIKSNVKATDNAKKRKFFFNVNIFLKAMYVCSSVEMLQHCFICLTCSKAPRRQFFRTCLYFIEYLRDLGFNERELEETGGSGSKTGKQGRSENFVSGGLGEN